jgi:hypothetical protein
MGLNQGGLSKSRLKIPYKTKDEYAINSVFIITLFLEQVKYDPDITNLVVAFPFLLNRIQNSS